MKQENIPVVWGLDKKYIFSAFVVMHSILQNSDGRYQFYIITADDITEEVQEYFLLLRRHYSNFDICVKKISEALFKDVKICNQHLSVAAYFRLSIPDLLLEYDKCIYLDCDVLVRGDLAELFQINIGDDYIAGVKDCHVIENTSRRKEHEKILGIPIGERYINSGVLLMNLRKMRTDKLVEKFMVQMKKENWYEDQDILNVCCYPYIKILPLKYNLFHFYYGKSIKFLYDLNYTERDFDFEEPFIIHMGAIWKPWNYGIVKCADEWWKLAGIFKDTEYYVKCYENIRCKDTVFYEHIQRNVHKQFVVCGYSDNGRNLCDLLCVKGYSNIAAIMDNSQEKWGEVYKGIPVMGIQQIVENYSDIFWIISNQVVFDEIRDQILNYGFEDKDMERYINYHNDRFYLLCLDSKYYDLEIDRIVLLEYVEIYPDYDERKKYILQILEDPINFKEQYGYLNNKYKFYYWYHV